MPQVTGPGFPPGAPFIESQNDSLGDGSPDFPGSAGGREQGKFRPSRIPKLTTLAVVNDDGSPIVPEANEVSIFDDMLMELRAIRIGIQIMLKVQEPDLGELSLLDMVENFD